MIAYDVGKQWMQFEINSHCSDSNFRKFYNLETYYIWTFILIIYELRTENCPKCRPRNASTATKIIKLTFLVVAFTTGMSSTSHNSNNFSLLHLSNFSLTLFFCFSCKENEICWEIFFHENKTLRNWNFCWRL